MDYTLEFDAPAEKIYQDFTSREYWQTLMDAYRFLTPQSEITSFSSGERGIDVVTTQTLRADRLPGVVTQFHRGDLSFVREETWTPIRDGQATATVKGAIRGAPATLNGTAVLAPAKSGAGSRLEFKASVEVKVPLVGGKIENFIGNQLVELLIAEQRFTTVWITENA